MDKKILTWDNLGRILELFNKEKIVFTNGCFDILHPGHIHILDQAKSYGDMLIVGLNSDNSIKRLKGPSRPKVSQNDRLKILSSIKFVDYVVLFEEETPLKLIEKIKPNFLVKGGDYTVETVVGHEIARVEIFPIVEGYSTTETIEKLNEKI